MDRWLLSAIIIIIISLCLKCQSTGQQPRQPLAADRPSTSSCSTRNAGSMAWKSWGACLTGPVYGAWPGSIWRFGFGPVWFGSLISLSGVTTGVLTRSATRTLIQCFTQCYVSINGLPNARLWLSWFLLNIYSSYRNAFKSWTWCIVR